MKIESGIPLPERGAGKQRFPFRQMNIGDSIFVEGEDIAGRAYRAAKQFQARYPGTQMDAHRVDGGIRIWRVK